jgi:PmbA protein
MFDDEGVPTRETAIIKSGILKNYLHNTSTAKKYKTKTTANAGLIVPSPINTILEEGNMPKEKLFKEIDNGLYITNVWYTRFQNYLTGDFSTIPRDGIFLIIDGEIAKSLKGIRISDNLQRILENIIGLSNKSEWIIWWGLENQIPVLTPHVLVKDVNITLPAM